MTRSLTGGLALRMYVQVIMGWRVQLDLSMFEVIIIIIIIIPTILRRSCNVITDLMFIGPCIILIVE